MGGDGGGGLVSQHALEVVSQHALQQVSRGGVCFQGVLLPGGGGPARRGDACSKGRSAPGRCLLPVGFSRPTPKGDVEGDQVQAHTQRGN